MLCGVALASEHQGAYAGGGLGFGTTNLTNDAVIYSDHPDRSIVLVEGHGGYRFVPYFALEGEILGAANGNDNALKRISFAGLSGRAVALAPVSEIVDLYALVGFYTGNGEVGVSDTVHESGAVYGAGFQLNFGSRAQYGVRGEYEVYKGSQLLDQVKGFTVSFQYNFFR
jgi:hypothetical protein